VKQKKKKALHLASAEGKIDVVAYLISAGADVNVVDRWQATPLQDALRHKQYAVVRLLQEHGGKLMQKKREKKKKKRRLTKNSLFFFYSENYKTE
jgi:ankyrin repeat protein